MIYLQEQLDRPAETLSHGQKQWLEIGMLLIQDPELLMLDEPVAGMSVSERAKTAELLKKIIKNRSVIVIEHDMKFVESIAHRVTVLHQGKVLAEGDMQSVQNNRKSKKFISVIEDGAGCWKFTTFPRPTEARSCMESICRPTPARSLRSWASPR
jgi:urea transport system ATP-binding protein